MQVLGLVLVCGLLAASLAIGVALSVAKRKAQVPASLEHGPLCVTCLSGSMPRPTDAPACLLNNLQVPNYWDSQFILRRMAAVRGAAATLAADLGLGPAGSLQFTSGKCG